MTHINFNNLFIFDLANNHQGDVNHALNIIREIGKICKEENINGAFKFQFRQLDTFIHPDFKNNKDVKHIPRFISTALSITDYKKLKDEVIKQGMISMCTPFDEESVDVILDLDIDIIKIASCSADDKPLLEKVSNTGRPVVISTAGLHLNQIDWIVSFFESKEIKFALMHCVAIYPTPNDKLNLNQIDLLKSRYPDIPIGFSTHEDPDNLFAVKMAFSKGAKLFERHVGISNEKYQLNKYSSTPEQIKKWIKSFKDAEIACGGEERSPAPIEEIESLRSLKRGVFAKKDIKKGKIISTDDVFFAMPLQENQLTSGEWHDNITADKDYKKNNPISEKVGLSKTSKDELIYRIMLQVKGILNNARIFVNDDASIEISHHYGLERFREYGAVIISCINRTYCKKLIILLPRQKHPYHYHKKKEETFQLLYGDMELEIDGKRYKMKPGDIFPVLKEKWHKFHTLDGAIFEEVSTTHLLNDSYYEDPNIAKLKLDDRKTNVDSWAKALKWRF